MSTPEGAFREWHPCAVAGCGALVRGDAYCWDHLPGGDAERLVKAKAAGLMLDGMTAYWPGIPCWTCGKFVGRDGYISVEYFEMSNEVASVEGQCRRCIDDAGDDIPDNCAACKKAVAKLREADHA